MKPLLNRLATRGPSGAVRAAVFCVALCGLLAAAPVLGQTAPDWLTVTGVASDGTLTGITDYRWLVEEDQSYHVQTVPAGEEGAGGAVPTVFDPNWRQGKDGVCGDGEPCILGDACGVGTCTAIPGGETLSVGFHDSHMPIVAKGCVNMPVAAACEELMPTSWKPETHYYVSVVPRSGASIGGASFVTDSGGNIPATTVYANEHPIPTAQISVFIFHDNQPINSAPDLPTEQSGLAAGQTDMSGFQIVVEDAGGRYGAAAGIMSQDAFGNPLGTTYNAAGDPNGYRPLITGPDGRINVKYLAPGKYGIIAIPPAGQNWQQTSTIEGTKLIDAWVKANEPPFFAEFGPAGTHVFIGFVKPTNDRDVLTGGVTITGRVVNQHLSRPPEYALHPGECFPHTTPWVGLNTAGGLGPAAYAAPTGPDCSFEITGVPEGSYQLGVWDTNLDLVFGIHGLNVVADAGGGPLTCSTPTGSCDLGKVPAFQWFHRQEHRVFDDENADGLWQSGEPPSAIEIGFNLRWRDGTLYQGNVSDPAGAFAFDQVFPFFAWLVAEVDFGRFQATGVTAIVDNGGAIPPFAGEPPLDGSDWTFGGNINPQDQTNPPLDVGFEFADYRYETGPVLTQGVQGFLGQTNAFLWGKRHYPDGQNGGISGMVFYAVTRAENDVRYAGAEPWEPGIPGVTVNLYDSTGTTLLATTETDNWDESIPTDCKWGNGALADLNSPTGNSAFAWSPDGVTYYDTDCYDGLRVFNQARPAVFDGGFAFDQICLDEDGLNGGCDSLSIPGQMPVGDYVVEVIPPTGYQLVKPENKNVDFGDEYIPATELLPPICVGDMVIVPELLTLFPDEAIAAPFAGQPRPLCDRKLVTLSTGANAAAEFFLFTEVPPAGRGFGVMLDDTQNEFDPNSPQFGEKYAPPFVPVAIRDWTGRVIGKTLSDQYGRYNFLAPSAITNNLPQPSGMSPNMLTTCMNDPGDDLINPDPNWNQQYSTFCYTFQYMPGVTTYLDTPVVPIAAFTGPDQFPLDCEFPDGTPRIFSVTVDTNDVGGGPYIPTKGGNNNKEIDGEDGEDQTITITSLGEKPVQNPEYCNPAAGACPEEADTGVKFVPRDFGFGTTPGNVRLGNDSGDIPLTCTWSDLEIECDIPVGTNVGSNGGRQLTVTRANGRSTKTGVTVQVGLRQGANAVVVGTLPIPGVPPPTHGALDTLIQDAIDDADANDLILVRPGIYNEIVVMWKPVQLQGFGEGSTFINAVKAPPEKLVIWRNLVDGLIANSDVDVLPGQEVGPGDPEPVTLWNEEGAGILVLAASGGQYRFHHNHNQGARIDGFTIKGADTGGGIIANGYTDYLEISNNRISNNQGAYGGGIRIGHPLLIDDEGPNYTDSDNDFVSIHHNQVVFNGGLGGAGAGISMCTGADSYRVTENWVCGNLNLGDGGGIGHIGVSEGDPFPQIADNWVIFNEVFNQGRSTHGGGIFIGGAPPMALIGGAGAPGTLSPGAGRVTVDGNLIQGNSAGAGDGGGVALVRVNGEDVSDNPDDAAAWYTVDVFNNMIVNNVAGLAGGGIALQDAVQVNIAHNTIANNDSLATAGNAFAPGSPSLSTAQPGAGVVGRAHTVALAGTGAAIGDFSDPQEFADNIIRQNRQFYFFVDGECMPGDPGCTATFGLCPDLSGSDNPLNCSGGNAVVYDDLGVIGATGCLSPTYSLLTDLDEDDPDCAYDDPTNVTGDPLFVAEYFNGARSSVVQGEGATAIAISAAFDEGGNYIRAGHGPLTLYCDHAACDPAQESNDGDPGVLFGDYHIVNSSPAFGAGMDLSGTFPELSFDFDLQDRPNGTTDIGADEYHTDYPAPAVTIPPGGDVTDATVEGETE